MRKFLPAFCLPLILVFSPSPLRAQEARNFSFFFHAGGDASTGFIQGDQINPEGGAGLGMSFDNHTDGVFTLDYYSLSIPGMFLSVPASGSPIPSPASQIAPTDDFSICLGIRWHPGEKRDEIRKKLKEGPYLLAGTGFDLLVDQYPRDGAAPFNASFDILFSMEGGAGMDFPLDSQWLFFTEGVDHLILWQGVTQIVSIRAGLKIMLDSAHADPFR